MKYVVFILIYPIIWCFSRLPMRLLYAFSDFLFLLVYYVVGYRKDVVYNNLKLAFPEKNDNELKTLRKKNLRHFCDFLVESIKSFSLSEKEVKKRYKFTNPEVLHEVEKTGKSIILSGAHLSNWEWSVSIPLVSNIQLFGSYTPIKNPYLDNYLVKSSRGRFGMISYKTHSTVTQLARNIRNKRQGAYILLSDQSPVIQNTHYWRTFLGVKVPVHVGLEVLSKRFDMAIVNYTTKKIKRGYYETTFELITDSPKEFENYQITDKYLNINEKSIREQPEYYLWTHKRFKHKDKYEEWVEKYKK
ncbi:lysophospholipid acyltransferase family protein [Tenacibaculum jejuense]|uniref:Putative lipd A biosynthesis related exported protein n=1 Tax=Tenacibaculum jejuense TaxID=584609 RepID=A0A238UD32_9FLAO|nr:lysophospholipid acyltransferase family protein [Tenacibaculum jejuense]SNR16488.1 putative lipd A biosynthesis related exported protein [Tenacibaculum jejuense]